MKKLYFLISFLFVMIRIFGQANWDGDSPIGNFTNNNNWYGDLSPTSGSSVDLYFNYRNNGAQTSINYDWGWADFRSITYASTFDVAIDFNGTNGINLGYKLENYSSKPQYIKLPLSAKGSVLELNPIYGDLVFTKPIFNDGNINLNIYGNNGKSIIFTQLSGFQGSSSANLSLNDYSIVIWDVNSPALYSGGTYINNGEFWIAKDGIVNSSTITVGNGSGSYCNIYLSDPSVATTATNNINVPSNSPNVTIGGLNSSNTHTYSGLISTNGNMVNFKEVSSTGTADFTGNITNNGGVRKIGPGTMRFTGSKDYTANTSIDEGTLQIGSDNSLPANGKMIFNGGTLSTGKTSGFTDVVGLMKLTDNSTLALGTGAHSITFADSRSENWIAEKILNITGWSPSCDKGGTVGKIFIGSDASALTAGQKAQIQFSGYAVGSQLLSTGELIPTAESLSATYSAGSWDFAPNANRSIVFNTDYSVTGTNLSGCNCTVNSAAIVKIGSGDTMTLQNEITVKSGGSFTLASDANLIQIDPVAANSGNITAERYVTDMDNVLATQMDYVYWSAPVTGQLLKGPTGFSPGTPDNRFFYYLESNDRFYETGDVNFKPARGYAIRAEVSATFPEDPMGYNKTYTFKGIPNNGDISFPITRSADNPVGTIHGYNLVGNPYPSNISFDELYDGNPGLINKTAWFWTNFGIYEQYQQGSSYSGNGYAIWNGTGGNPATSPAGTSIPNGIIKVGQGFLVQKKVESTEPLIFKNKYGTKNLRVGDAGTFYQKGAVQKNRFSLSLLSPSTLENSLLIGYVDGATDQFEQDYDAEAFSLSSDLFYSILGDKKLLIQGKANNFTDTDRIILGANFFQNGTYTISLNNAGGVFEGGQNIYLKDKQEGIITNLSQGDSTFTATKGDNATRFEIIYKPESILATDASVKEDLVIYRKDNDFVVKSQGKKINLLDVYDTTGRLIYTSQPKRNEAIIPAEKLLNSVYVLKINRNGEISTKKIIR